MSFVLGTAGVKRATVSETSRIIRILSQPYCPSRTKHLFLVVVSLMQSLWFIKMLWGKIRFTSYAYDGDGTFSGATQKDRLMVVVVLFLKLQCCFTR